MVSTEDARHQAIERAARALLRAIVDLVQATAMPTEDPQLTIPEVPRRPDDALTMKQVCEITGLRPRTFYNLRIKDEGPPFWVMRNRLRCYRPTWRNG